MGIETGIDMSQLLAAGRFISDYLGREPSSKVNIALTANATLSKISKL